MCAIEVVRCAGMSLSQTSLSQAISMMKPRNVAKSANALT